MKHNHTLLSAESDLMKDERDAGNHTYTLNCRRSLTCLMLTASTQQIGSDEPETSHLLLERKQEFWIVL